MERIFLYGGRQDYPTNVSVPCPVQCKKTFRRRAGKSVGMWPGGSHVNAKSGNQLLILQFLYHYTNDPKSKTLSRFPGFFILFEVQKDGKNTSLAFQISELGEKTVTSRLLRRHNVVIPDFRWTVFFASHRVGMYGSDLSYILGEHSSKYGLLINTPFGQSQFLWTLILTRNIPRQFLHCSSV